MVDEGEHAACVDAWLERSAKDLSPDLLLTLFEAALRALYSRTKTTLGEVTLTAIAERVLYSASEKFPLLSFVHVEPTGIECGELRSRVRTLRGSELRDGVRWVLVQLLAVLGNLTADILTPELHAALSGVTLPSAGGAGETRTRARATRSAKRTSRVRPRS